MQIILEKKGEYNETVHRLFIDLKELMIQLGQGVLYNILIELGTTMKLVGLIYWAEAYIL